MGRRIGGALAGVAAGVVIIMIVEALGTLVFPMPKGLDPRDKTAMAAFMSKLPIGMFLYVLAGFLLATLVATWLASYIGRTRFTGVIVGSFFLVVGILNLMMVPHPVWFWIACIGVFIGSTVVGSRMGARGRIAA